MYVTHSYPNKRPLIPAEIVNIHMNHPPEYSSSGARSTLSAGSGERSRSWWSVEVSSGALGPAWSASSREFIVRDSLLCETSKFLEP